MLYFKTINFRKISANVISCPTLKYKLNEKEKNIKSFCTALYYAHVFTTCAQRQVVPKFIACTEVSTRRQLVNLYEKLFIYVGYCIWIEISL